MTTRRVHDADATLACGWRQRFDTLVRERMTTPFEWGVQDCCIWPADCVKAMTGVDHAAAWRGTYSTEAEAEALLQSLGGLMALGALAGPPCAPLAAGPGDVGLLRNADRGTVLGVCSGKGWLVPASGGLALLPLDSAVRAWKVPHG